LVEDKGEVVVIEPDEAPVRGSSYVAVAYNEIRSMILSGELAAGARVTVRPLVDRLELSPTPIRTALAALHRQGMLEAHEHRGYFVPQMGRDDMLEIYEVREAVDGIASRRAAQSESRAPLVETLQGVLAEQARCVAEGDINTYRDLDVTFHLAIWRASGNRRLLSISDNLLGQVRIGNNISAKAPGRLAAALSEHTSILEALRTGDAQAAERATRHHVRQASAALGDLLD